MTTPGRPLSAPPGPADVSLSTIERLARFAADLSFETLPPPVVDRARACLLDGIGCILGAWSFPEGPSAVAHAAALGGRPEAAIPGSEERMPASSAVYAAGCLMNMLDFDDTAPLAGHPGASLVPVALAAAWLRWGRDGGTVAGVPLGAPGADLLTALVAGYDIALRVARAGSPSEDCQAHVRGHATWQTFGAAAVAGRLLGLGAAPISHALGLAALHAPVPFVGRWYQRPVDTLKNNYGWVALGGWQSAILAGAGWRGNTAILDGRGGFWEMAGSDRWQPEVVADGLGDTFRIMDVAFKAYPACWHLGAALGSLERIVRKAGLGAEQVARIRVDSIPRVMEFADWAPQSPFDAQFSLPYVCAMVLLGVPPGPEWYTPERLRAPMVRELMARVDVAADPAIPPGPPGRTPARVTVESADGTRWVEEARWPPGDPVAPPSWGEIEGKFRRLARGRLGEDESTAIVRWARALGGDAESEVRPA